MNIIVDPKWTFIEALEAAWKAYGGGLEHGVPNRIRVLEQWANVVGRHKAVSEFEEALAAYKNLSEINEKLGLSSHTVRRLRKNFNLMPEVTPFSLEFSKSPTIIKQLQDTENDISKIDIVLNQFLNLTQESGIDFVQKLIDWIRTTVEIKDIINIIEKININDLQELNAAIGLNSLKKVLEIWENNKTNHNEEFWQEALTQNSFIFAHLFAFPVIVLENKAYVGGKSISNKGGNIIDFLCANNLTRNVALIEIKTPTTKLLGSKYRGDIYNISNELSGSAMQVANYRNSLIQNYISIINPGEERFEVFDPKCIIVIGNITSELTDLQQRKSLELFRMGLKDIQIITYDELFGKIEFLVNLLETDINNFNVK